MKVVLDMNVLISAFLWQGKTKEIFILGQAGKINFCANQEMIDEFYRVLQYPKFRRLLQSMQTTPESIIQEYLETVWMYPVRKFAAPFIIKDPSDDMFLECAIISHAEYIVSGDKHLLQLEKFRGIEIISPHAFLENKEWGTLLN